jgi:hypothetical protein
MRIIPRKPNNQQKLVIRACEDFFAKRVGESRIVSKVALFIMGRKKRLGALAPEEEEAVWYVRQNLQDPTYRKSLGTA